MAGRRIDGFSVARGWTVSAAVIWRAKVRATLENLAGNFDVRLARIVAVRFAATARVLRNAAGLRRIGLVLCAVPVDGPFPDIADHVVEAITVWRERGYG